MRNFVICLLFCIGLTGCLVMATPTLPPTATLRPPTGTPTLTPVWFPPTVTPTAFPTATPMSPTPEQRPGLGEIILSDDFVTADAWELSSTTKGSVALGHNELSIYVAASKTYISSFRSEPILGDFYVEITASPTLCRGLDEYGLLFRAASPQDYYRFSLSCDGQVRLSRVYRGEVSFPQPWMLGTMIPVGAPSVSRLGVWVVGKEMRFFVNDQYQFTAKDPLFANGRLGIFARSAGETVVTVSFSALVVRQVIK
jgi:hypothetical protein